MQSSYLHLVAAESVRTARLARGWTQDDLAGHAHVSRPSVARIETGGLVSLHTLVKVAAALELKVTVGVGRSEQ